MNRLCRGAAVPTARPRRTVRALALALGLSLTAALTATLTVIAGGTAEAGGFPPLGGSTVHPGVVLYVDNKACTANFVFRDAAGHYYIGEAAHCVASGAPAKFNGCLDPVLPLGSEIGVAGSDVKGKLAYSSWATMQKIGEKDGVVCLTNDFALVRLPDDAIKTLNPSVPYFGGPTGLAPGNAGTGDFVYSFGNSPLRYGISDLAPKRGVIVDRTDSDWTFLCYFVTPVIPGDSGSGVMDEQGRALGVASSLIFLPHPASNGVANLAKALAYAQAHSGIRGLQLVLGTETFREN
jgi:hypothetical protein